MRTEQVIKTKWVKVHDPEEIHQLRAWGGHFGIGAVAGACGPSTKHEGKFWARVGEFSDYFNSLTEAKSAVESRL